MEDLRSGRLPRATAELAVLFAASGANYTTCEVPLRQVRLWQRAAYTRTRFLRWLFKAEGLVAEPCEKDWDLLVGMGSGAEKGVAAAGGLSYAQAVAACGVVAEDLWAASGAPYGLDDLVCFLCLSQNKEALGRGELAEPAAAVTVAGDLGLRPPCATAPEQGRRRRRRCTTPDASRWAAPRADFPTLLARVSPHAVVEWLPLPDHVRLCLTSLSVCLKCLIAERPWALADCWHTVRVLVEKILRKDAPTSAALTASGVSDGVRDPRSWVRVRRAGSSAPISPL